jgi:ATP-binding cassette subfamily C (CFTR/MRP) protein 10
MYADLLRTIFHASLRFFDATPVGRIINRFSRDTYSIDESLPFILNIFLKDFADVTGTLVIIFYGNRFVVLLLIPLSAIYFRLQASYRPLSRHVHRLEATAQSPILSLLTSTLEGLGVIRGMKKEQQYRDTYESCLNTSQRMEFISANAGSWFGIRLDMLGVCVSSFVAVFAVFDFQVTGRIHPGMIGLTLTYALPVVGKLNSIIGSFVETERQMIAVERVKEYSTIAAEEDASDTVDVDLRDLSMWPRKGTVCVSNLSVVYTSSDVNVSALREVNCTIQEGEKIGICGRTGAGKSTFMYALFRAVKWQPNSVITVDDVAIDRLPLQFLRSRITYIPQDVVIFSGTIRSNLDPEGTTENDSELWRCLEGCNLNVAVSRLPQGLDTPVENCDTTFSKGQVQLLCIARALLRKSKVLCVDEATSSIDYESEGIITEVCLCMTKQWRLLQKLN